MRHWKSLCLSLLFGAPLVGTLAQPCLAQTAELQSTRHPVSIDSGYVENSNPAAAAHGIPAVVWSTVVSVPSSSWVRLSYAGILLSGQRERGGDGSYLRLTSILTGEFQTQHLVHVEQWRDTSAYFNGDAVLVELLACPGTGANRLQISEVTAGPALPVGTDSICGPIDRRTLSNDARIGRLVPVGCTGWQIDDCNRCFLTAGHCAGSGMQVLEFHCPLSTGSGALVHPGPQDQYAVDSSSQQASAAPSLGNDWDYFGVFPNSTTGLTPYQASNGQAFTLLSSPPAVANQPLRITGYGVVSAPVSPTWEQVQKTHVGPYTAVQGTRLDYLTDTTGGNSGSPVFLDGTNQAIGIHTHGGCTVSGGNNSGTSGSHIQLQAALAAPTGVCYCEPISFLFPNGQPTLVSPGGVTTLRVQIGGNVPMQPGSLELHYSYAGPTQMQTLVPVALGNNLFEVAVPGSNCMATLTYYWSARDTTNVAYTSPRQAPTSVHSATVATNLATIRTYNFNTSPPGWTVVNTNVVAGGWTRGTLQDPRGPYADYDGSGQCWVTGNTSLEDLNGGPTRLRTETIDVSAATNPIVRYALWFTCNSNDDRLLVEATQDNGANWVLVEYLSAFAGWEIHGFRVLDHFAVAGQISVRWSVADSPNNSTTEAAVDAFLVADATCPPPSWTSFGMGCAPTGPVPTLSAITLPAIGNPFVLSGNNLGAGAPILIAGLSPTSPPTPLTPYGWGPGCALYVTPDVALFAFGGVIGFGIPNDPSLSGIRLYYQMLELGQVLAATDAGIAEIR
jgi:V8-like Glu-specific endopeptidase